MKKIRVFLSAMAVMLAVGASFAFQPLVNGYEFIPGAGGTNSCQPILNIDCQEQGNSPCTSPSGYDVRQTALTTCGTPFKRP